MITRQKGASAVLLSRDEFQSLEETAYLLRSPANARHLRRAITQTDRGNTRDHKPLK